MTITILDSIVTLLLVGVALVTLARSLRRSPSEVSVPEPRPSRSPEERYAELIRETALCPSCTQNQVKLLVEVDSAKKLLVVLPRTIPASALKGLVSELDRLALESTPAPDAPPAQCDPSQSSEPQLRPDTHVVHSLRQYAALAAKLRERQAGLESRLDRLVGVQAAYAEQGQQHGDGGALVNAGQTDGVSNQ
jgi:hypothetical protein